MAADLVLPIAGLKRRKMARADHLVSLVRASVAGDRETLRAAAERIEEARALPLDVVSALHDARLFRLLLPRSIGGDEVHLKVLAEVMETVARADASTAWCLGQAAGCAMSA